MIKEKKGVPEDRIPPPHSPQGIGTTNLHCTVVPIAGKGRGVVAERDFAAGDVIEQAPVIVVPASDAEKIRETTLNQFWYEWEDDGSYAIVGGCGSFYNHSFDPNADYIQDFSSLKMAFVALRAIRAGEEATINYHGVLGCLDPLNFEVH